MPTASLHLDCPTIIAPALDGGSLRIALDELVALLGAELTVGSGGEGTPAPSTQTGAPIRYRQSTVGSVSHPGTDDSPVLARHANAIAGILEHIVDRESAVENLAEALMTSFDELDMLYTLLPSIATTFDEAQLGEVLVEQTARILRCRRVSLLVLDEKRNVFRVAASRGLPDGVQDTTIPLAGSITQHELDEEDVLVVSSLQDRPELAAMSRGEYFSDSFAVVRMPLRARGKALGFLAITDRYDDGEFTARDLKLLEGISAMGASALLGCRLHTTVNKQMMSTIEALASAVDAKDHYTRDHAGRVAALCVATARELGVADPAELRDIELAGLLHDVGKIGIPDAILSKAEKLNTAEFATMRTHVRIGADIVRHVPGLEAVGDAILYHHERYDGLGYVAGLCGDAIPLAAKLIAVADTYDSMTTDRPYRRAVGKPDAIREIQCCTGTQLDPSVADATVRVLQKQESSSTPYPSPVAAADRNT